MHLDAVAPINTAWGPCPGGNYKWQGTCITKQNLKTIEKAVNTGSSVSQHLKTGKFYLSNQLRNTENEMFCHYGDIDFVCDEALSFLTKIQKRNNKLRTKREILDAKNNGPQSLSFGEDIVFCCDIIAKKMIGKRRVTFAGGRSKYAVVMDILYIDSDGEQKDGAALLNDWRKNKCLIDGYVKLLN